MDPEKKEPSAPDPSPGTPESPAAEKPQDAAVTTPPADSSPAPDESRKTLLDAVRDAVGPENVVDEDAPVEKKPTTTAESSTAPGAQPAPEDKGKPETKEDTSDEALLAVLDQLKDEKVPLNKIERFREVIAENRQLKATNDRYTELDEALNTIGSNARKVGLSQDELAQIFAWPNLLASDPGGAVKQLREFCDRWEGHVGNTLPDDLKQKVDDGVLDEATAKEVAGLRAKSRFDKTRQDAEVADRERDAATTKSNGIRDAVNRYQEELKSSDADYTPELHKLVVSKLTEMVTFRGAPDTEQAAVAMAREAVTEVKRTIQSFRPPPRAIKPTATGRTRNTPATAAPANMFEAVTQALENMPAS